jgi:hypothetical protein
LEIPLFNEGDLKFLDLRFEREIEFSVVFVIRKSSQLQKMIL